MTPLPRILLHSDLHLDSGPFSLPTPEAAPAVAVFAGDVHRGAESVDALSGITGLPAVFVPGNHDFWGGDYFELLAQMRNTRSANVHVLENRAVVLEGVRFLGATLWTDYGGGHEALMDYGLWHMNDNRCIKAASWWTAANKARFLATFGQHALEKFEGNFNPLLARELHARSVAWLRRALATSFDGPTVIVTHHAPCYASLLKSGAVREYALKRESWQRRMNDDLNLTKVGSYASNTLERLERELARADVRLWCHGHVHHAMKFALNGIQIACNPRGRVHPPLTEESAQAFALFGFGVSKADIERSQQRAREFPEDGDGYGYDRNFCHSLDDDGYGVIQEAHENAVETLTELHEEMRELRAASRSSRTIVADLAAHRADTLKQTGLETVRKFALDMHEQLLPVYSSYSPSMGLHSLLRTCKLAPGGFNGRDSLAGVENTANYATTKRFRQDFSDSADMPAERFGARRHVQHVDTVLRRLSQALSRARQACVAVQTERRRLR
ncbi:hypothetical protein G3A43_06895 [Paraburkholderia aspalathi]|nr:metallophosphoesterase [Paraburkholderia aspalathi]MBK3779978.1 hypothetical protein [Paraburkholderia aspalathi]